MSSGLSSYLLQFASSRHGLPRRRTRTRWRRLGGPGGGSAGSISARPSVILRAPRVDQARWTNAPAGSKRWPGSQPARL